MVRLPYPSLIVLVGPSAAGKSTWAAANFRPEQIISSDALRALVGEGEHDLRASTDAFAVLDLIVERRLKRRLVTVVDTLGLDRDRRAKYRELAARHGVACHAVIFDTPAEVCRARNKARGRPVPAKVLAGQLIAWAKARDGLAAEGFDRVDPPSPVEIVPAHLLSAPRFAQRQKEEPMPLRFGLQIPSFAWAGGPEGMAEQLGAIGTAAERAGFTSLWVMDHFIQIPQVGPEWQDMMESYTTLGFLAGRTSRIRLGTLVTGVTYRNLAHLAKIVATLDVLSDGRAVCGLGAGLVRAGTPALRLGLPAGRRRASTCWRTRWNSSRSCGAREHLRSKGGQPHIAEAICYPRPRQEHIPVLIGGSGERRTLRLVARYADACNLFGDPETRRPQAGRARPALPSRGPAAGIDPRDPPVHRPGRR